jgi:hypothetical protein
VQVRPQYLPQATGGAGHQQTFEWLLPGWNPAIGCINRGAAVKRGGRH